MGLAAGNRFADISIYIEREDLIGEEYTAGDDP